MQITLENIQGFEGHHSYEINDLVTIINSKHNGVGKTTLFDCLRFLCNENLVDKDEREFFLNLNTESGLFSVKVSDVTHGFAFMKGQPPLFFRIIDGEDMERSDTNFPGVGADIGILQINGSLLNIFSKEVNLFSGSNVKENYQLIKEITTHEETEEALELMTRSEEINKQSLNQLRMEKKLVDSQVSNLSYYSNVIEMEEMLDNKFYVEFEDLLEYSLTLLSSLHQTGNIEVDSAILDYADTINDKINELMPVDNFSLNLEPLDKLETTLDLVDLLHSIEEMELQTTPLEKLEQVITLVSSLEETSEVESLDLTSILQMESVINAIDAIQEVVELDVDINIVHKVSEVCVTLAQMITNDNKLEYHTTQLSRLRESVASVRVACPIREEVYLVNGHCNY